MIGAIIGDVVGSPYELNTIMEVDSPYWQPLFHPTLSKFTDDTVLTCASADAIRQMTQHYPDDWPPRFSEKYREWALKYPNKGYGGTFWAWANQEMMAINKSYANGCMMRCSPIAEMWDWDIAMEQAKRSIEHTHNSPESLRGISAIVAAIQLSRQGKTKLQIQAFIEENYGHMLTDSIEWVRNNWDKRNIRCNITCAQALICFLNSEDFESAVRLGVYSMGDCDTIAAIAGSVAEAFYGPHSIPKTMIEETKARLNPEMIELINWFYRIIGSFERNEKYKGFQI